MEHLLPFIAVGAVALLGAMSPGPDFAVVMKNALFSSRRAGFATALGVALGCLVHVTYSIIGIGALIAQSILAFTIVKWVGAFYLLYLGIKMLSAKKSHALPEVTDTQTTRSSFAAFKEGLLTNVLNPKATLFFLAVFTQVVAVSTPIALKAAYGLEMVVLAGLWFCVLSAFLNIRIFKDVLSRSLHRIEQAMGVILIALAGKVAFEQH